MDLNGGPKQSSEALIVLIEKGPVSFYPSLVGKIKLLFSAASLLLLGSFFIWLGKADSNLIMMLFGIAILLFGLLFGALLLKKFGQNTPCIQVTKDGLFDYQNLKGTFIAWDEISKAALYKQNHNTFLGLYLVDAEAKRPHQSQLSKASNNFGHQLGLPDLIYPQSLLGGQKADTLVEAIEQLRLKYNNPFK